MFRRAAKLILATAVGAMPLATTATCDPRTGAFFFDRYDDDDYFFGGGGFVDFFVDDTFYYQDDYYYDDGFAFDFFY